MANEVTISHPEIVWSVAARALPGQKVSGDLHLVKGICDGALLAVIDGLGHGEEAVAASDTAVAVLEANAGEPLDALVRRCHVALMKTRGVVMTLAALRYSQNRLTWLGVGNVEAMLLRADSRVSKPAGRALNRGGIVGYQLPDLQASSLPLESGDLLIFATDGVNPGFADSVVRTDEPERIAEKILEERFKGNDDALVLVVRYLGNGHE